MLVQYTEGDLIQVDSVDDEQWEHLVGQTFLIHSLNNEHSHPVTVMDHTFQTYSFRYEQISLLAVPNGARVSVSEGGSLRYNKGKPEFSHLSPEFILEMMKTMTKANEKYPYLNYTKKQDVKTASDSLMRHYLSFQMGQNLDDETSCHHLAHLAVNAMIIFQNLKDYGDEVDNRYSIAKKKVQDDD